MAKCKNCKCLEFNNLTGKNRCFLLGEIKELESNRFCGAYRPMSNADRIRSMTDEELAEFLDDIAYYCKGRQNETYCSNCRFYFLGECNCVSIGEWLKSEVGCE